MELVRHAALLAGLLIFVHSTFATDSSSEWKAEAVKKTKIEGRTVIRYEHDCLRQWGYAAPRRDYFYVILPEKLQAAPPMLVLLHSAGGSGETELEGNVRFVVETAAEFVGLVPNAGPSGDPDWWWGAHLIQKDPERYGSTLTPVENRVLATVDWAARIQHVDRNRVYLHGISMGGSGTLGLGMCHGDIFAAICAKVPAGADHVMHRMGFPEPTRGDDDVSVEAPQAHLRRVSGVGLADAPPLLTFSSQTDNWSVGQESLMKALCDGRHSVIFTWGPWGHQNVYERYNRAAYTFPWFKIRKNQAYPVFTHASTDDHYPGHESAEPDQEGQINALFRWKNLEDSPERFAMELRLVRDDELSQRPRQVKLPVESVADVTIRRLQQFKIDRTGQYVWKWQRQEETIASGTVRPDAAELLTAPRLTISQEPAELVFVRL